MLEDVLYGWSLPKNQSSIIEKGSGVPLDHFPGDAAEHAFFLSLLVSAGRPQAEGEGGAARGGRELRRQLGRPDAHLALEDHGVPMDIQTRTGEQGLLLGFMGESTQPSAQLCTHFETSKIVINLLFRLARPFCP